MKGHRHSDRRRRGGSMTGVIGALSGAGIAIGVPWIVLVHGGELHAAVVTTIIILAILFGGAIALTAALFGTVMGSLFGRGSSLMGEHGIMGKHGWGSPKAVGEFLREIDPDILREYMNVHREAKEAEGESSEGSAEAEGSDDCGRD